MPSQPQIDPSHIIPSKIKSSRTVENSSLGLKESERPLKTNQVLKDSKLLLSIAPPFINSEVKPLVSNFKIATTESGAIPHSQPYPFPFTANSVDDDYTVYPYNTIGTLTFTDPRDGGYYVCTAALVNTPNGNTIFTAGHCIGEQGIYFTNFQFIPGNYQGQAPYGVWTACGRYPTTSWLSKSDATNDIGAIKVCPRPSDGASLSSVVGSALGIIFKQPRNLNWTVIGYPSISTTSSSTSSPTLTSSSFASNVQYFCQSSHGHDDPDTKYSTRPPIGIGCNMDASGSPVLFDYGRKVGSYINGVLSYRYPARPTAVYTSYFGQNAEDLYKAVVANGG